MAVHAGTIQVATRSPRRVARAVDQLLSRVERPAALIVFVSGPLSQQLEGLAETLRGVAKGLPTLVVPGDGVLTERGEVEHESAAAAVAWRGGRARLLAVTATDTAEACRLLAYRTGQTLESSPCTAALVFTRGPGLTQQALEPLRCLGRAPPVFGGASTAVELLAIDAEGEAKVSSAAALLLQGTPAPIVGSSLACRLVSEPLRITRASGSTVFELDDEPALDALSQTGSRLVGEPLLLVALVAGPDEPPRPPVVRAVHGVDPVRGGLILSERVPEGTWLAFAVREAGAARADLQRMLRDVATEACGAAVRFGLYLNGRGRGTGLYGASDVDCRMIRARFGDLPLAGVTSAFEFVADHRQTTLQLCSGALALFTIPS
ncbi:MAG: FIST C-terminal domain-containing protein [Polyangiaceae bacterium]|nr:FIST C-terminal domain-containing protein [Polyangiaceae bacterium]